MRDVDHRLRLEGFPGRRHQERAAWIAEYVNHGSEFRICDVRKRSFGERTQVAQGDRAPDPARVCRLVGQSLEELLADLPLPRAAQFRIGLLGVTIQRMRPCVPMAS